MFLKKLSVLFVLIVFVVSVVIVVILIVFIIFVVFIVVIIVIIIVVVFVEFHRIFTSTKNSLAQMRQTIHRMKKGKCYVTDKKWTFIYNGN